MDYVAQVLGILNLKGHCNPIFGSKVTALLLNGWVLSIFGVSLGRVCACSMRRWFVFKRRHITFKNLVGN